jgi:hypothetical protein
MNQPPTAAPDVASELFYAGAIRRILRFIVIFATPAVVIFSAALGLQAAVGCAIGAALAYEGFRELTRAASALAARITERQSKERGARIVARFLFRYIWMGISAYAIFRFSLTAVYGFLGGLCIPVPAMMAEAAYEAYVALRRGI